MASVVLHDNRLKGITPVHYDRRWLATNKNPIDDIIAWVWYEGRKSPVWPLHILCHGYQSKWFTSSDGTWKVTAHGGFGLALGKNDLTIHNVHKTKDWKGRVELIVLFACAPADDTLQGKVPGQFGDGRAFCRKLFEYSGATVIAARETQYYYLDNGVIDFEDREGPVFAFDAKTPNGRQLVHPNVYRLLRKK